jgi:bacillithiol biosynthesis cysteine-adding enzyme BshC
MFAVSQSPDRRHIMSTNSFMHFTAKRIPYQQTGYFSRVITDYLNGNEFLKHFYEYPVSHAGIEAAIKDREKYPTDRNLLTEALQNQYKGLSVHEAVGKNLKSLSDRNTYTITTAHQPAIFTGSLYFIYKILHVIKIAETLSSQFPECKFVPVFFMGSEDADLDELGHIYLNGEKLVWDSTQTGSVGRMRPDGLEEIIARIENEYAVSPYGAELIQLLRDCYLGSENIQTGTLRFLNLLFGSYGLIVLIPDSRLLKSAMRGVFKDDLTSHLPYQITVENNRHFSERYPVQANPREINLFYLKDNIRERLDQKDGDYVVNNTLIRFSLEEMQKELADFPERFSPNVILRGLLQETLLPNIAFVGGGGEMAYWLEFKPLFSHYHLPFPVLILRNSFLLIRKNWKAKMDKAGLMMEDLFKPEEQLMEEYVRRHSGRQLSLERQIGELRSLYCTVKDISGAVDKTLEQHVEKLESQALQKLEELEKKMLRAEKKYHEEMRRRIHEIRESLFPMGNLQERIENLIPWYAEYGNSFIELIYQHSSALEQNFVVLEEYM